MPRQTRSLQTLTKSPSFTKPHRPTSDVQVPSSVVVVAHGVDGECGQTPHDGAVVGAAVVGDAVVAGAVVGAPVVIDEQARYSSS